MLRTLALGKTIQQKAYFTVKCWISHVICWIRYWKWKTERMSVSRMVLSTWAVSWPSWLRGWLGAEAAATDQHHERWSAHISLAQKRSKFKVWFLLNVYLFHTIVKSKNCKSNSCRTQVWLLATRKSIFNRQVLVGKERLIYFRAWRPRERVDSCLRTNSRLLLRG